MKKSILFMLVLWNAQLYSMYIWVGLYQLAAEEGDIKYAQDMLEATRISPDVQSEFTLNTALHRAALAGKIDFIMWLNLTYNVNLNLQNNEGATPLHLALMYDKQDVAEYLLTQPNINCNIQDKDGNTILFYIVAQENQYLLSKALRWGADPRIKNNEKHSPLTIAQKKKDKSIYLILKARAKKLGK